MSKNTQNSPTSNKQHEAIVNTVKIRADKAINFAGLAYSHKDILSTYPILNLRVMLLHMLKVIEQYIKMILRLLMLVIPSDY